MLHLILAILVIFYMFFVVIKIRKKKIDELTRFLNNVNYSELKSKLIKSNEKDRQRY
ncbi:hypothetical protein DW1_0877 [Proteiniborus sp. DW1]|uniref:hypothetical protein n=1 Tax=Proteiniborus sp. DW1 TaxID=1889883 RepID=UPI00092DF8B8|nr:hypothetical protein [Proteiniborus sp. DW1]SCG82485.1 hypothetical protein DW1_0877 [Proteiniborus sp. DW1]